MKIALLAIFLVVPGSLPAEDKCVGVDYLQDQFKQLVGGISLAEGYKKVVLSQVSAALNLNKAIEPSQYILFVDRNPSAQAAILFFLGERGGDLIIIGADKVSTGNPARRGRFATPTGFVENCPENMSYRALGTKNSKGWRGLGTKGSRVWDFGWTQTSTAKGDPYLIRLLLHATDPDHGEARLGKVDSKGCIRISAKFNRFLDYFGILDAKYEKNGKASYVLLAKREPVCSPGRFVLVGDSGGK